MKLYSIYDRAAVAHMRPWTARHDGEALRSFGDLVNDRETAVGQHPEDYTLFAHGTFDEVTGDVVAEPKRSLGNGLDYVREA